mmetsp:Transcript_99687/g.157790  ORF Transcript_99687/g.157790 Transcript_99687/m.157790 type:complete len:136 (-) Transcript_99687:177-584(-)|eukprot:CAMPEP_0169090296 /NCGR_PEP_ID=MMETSP1015-20121227/15742_1 /TAXON_ID=342587 /ORGANISM="Karlodinium micrum, Strain CCMP2283" /LENGTH=135 /DNA_ID=CAMNT_0009150689 /DNA_START=55 /DNA_END=462 /DNA_ORIENTATION=-
MGQACCNTDGGSGSVEPVKNKDGSIPPPPKLKMKQEGNGSMALDVPAQPHNENNAMQMPAAEQIAAPVKPATNFSASNNNPIQSIQNQTQRNLNEPDKTLPVKANPAPAHTFLDVEEAKSDLDQQMRDMLKDMGL